MFATAFASGVGDKWVRSVGSVIAWGAHGL